MTNTREVPFWVIFYTRSNGERSMGFLTIQDSDVEGYQLSRKLLMAAKKKYGDDVIGIEHPDRAAAAVN
jgi:hypothetical protein